VARARANVCCWAVKRFWQARPRNYPYFSSSCIITASREFQWGSSREAQRCAPRSFTKMIVGWWELVTLIIGSQVRALVRPPSLSSTYPDKMARPADSRAYRDSFRIHTIATWPVRAPRPCKSPFICDAHLPTRQLLDKTRIIPIWHRVSKSEVIRYSPTLADTVALNTSLLSIMEISIELQNLLGANAHGSDFVSPTN